MVQEFSMKLPEFQAALLAQGIDGWLVYDFRRSNDLACKVLGIDEESMLTRRFFYWVPASGEPVKIVHRVEEGHLDHLPGGKLPYSSWKELEARLEGLLRGVKRAAMEYSPRNAIPTVSKVDAGTVDLIRELGVEVVSSADLLQRESVWSDSQLKSHYHAAETVDTAVSKAWSYIRDKLASGEAVNEYEVQQLILSEFRERGCVSAGDPIVAVNGNAADPHYTPTADVYQPIRPGDWVLIDLWCKEDRPDGIYADICRVGVAASAPTEKHEEIFSIVKASRDSGIQLVRDRFSAGEPVMGWEVDQACRDVIEEAGYADYFVHRTGHSIDTSDHGDGANIDNLETQDRRLILLGSGFSIEPGIYLPGEFGVRMEYDVYIHPDGKVEVTGGIQENIECLM